MQPHNDARQIVQTLAQGLDPFSGESLPSEHLLNHPDIAQALLAASAALEISAARVRSRAHTENVGRQWSDTEEQELMVAFRSGKSLEEIAIQHRRSLTGIEARLEKLGLMSPEQRMTRNRFPRPAGAPAGAVQEDPPMDDWEVGSAE